MSINFNKLESLLAEKGKTFYSLRKDKIVGTETIKKLQQSTGIIDTRTINNLCKYLDCQPGNIMEYIADESTANTTTTIAAEPERQKKTFCTPNTIQKPTVPTNETLNQKLERLRSEHTTQ